MPKRPREPNELRKLFRGAPIHDMSSVYASPSDTNTAAASTAGPATDTPSTSTVMQGIRKRMRSGQHKHSIPTPDSAGTAERSEHRRTSNEFIDTSLSEFVDLLRMNEIFSQEEQQAIDTLDEHATSSNKRFCTTPPAAKRTAIALSPPPTPGRNHADAQSYRVALPFPMFLPVGDRHRFNDLSSRLAPPSLEQQPDDDGDGDSGSDGGAAKVPSSLLDSYPPTSTIFRLKPAFTSELVQNFAQQQQQEDDESSPVNVPQLPFQFLPPRGLQQQDELRRQTTGSNSSQESSPKVSTDMAMAPLPPSRGHFERANAA